MFIQILNQVPATLAREDDVPHAIHKGPKIVTKNIWRNLSTTSSINSTNFPSKEKKNMSFKRHINTLAPRKTGVSKPPVKNSRPTSTPSAAAEVVSIDDQSTSSPVAPSTSW